MTSWTIERVAGADLTRVRDLARIVWPVAFKGLIADHDISAIVEAIYHPRQLERDVLEGHCFWIARDRQGDAGFAAAYREGETIWLKKLYIAPDRQGSGLGSRLISIAEQHFAPAAVMSLFVKNDNAPAIGFYKRLGFSIVREEPVIMGHQRFTDYVMSRLLA